MSNRKPARKGLFALAVMALMVVGPVHAGTPVAHGELAAPKYPAGSRGQGTVVMHLQVGADGGVRQVRLVRSSGHDELDRAAMATARDWRFTPATEGGKPVASWISVPVNFERHGRDPAPSAPAGAPVHPMLAAT